MACQNNAIQQSYKPTAEDIDGDGYDESVDCDETRTDIHPGAPEVCDGVDNDCDGLIDDDDTRIEGGTLYYVDIDGDEYGQNTEPQERCEPDPNMVLISGDCDDTDSGINPDAEEDCSTASDDNCDGDYNGIDALACINWYTDADADGHYGGEPLCMCLSDDEYTSQDFEDCDDDNPEVSPDAIEVCNDGIDNNCDSNSSPCTWAGDLDTLSSSTKFRGLDQQHLGEDLFPTFDLNQDGTNEIWMGSAKGAYLFASPFNTVVNAEDAIASTPVNIKHVRHFLDYNLDGTEDILASGRAGTAEIYLSPFSGVMEASQTFISPTNDELHAVYIENLNGNSSAHLAFLSLYEGDLFIIEHPTEPTVNISDQPDRVYYWSGGTEEGDLYSWGDRDGDGLDDILIGIPNTQAGSLLFLAGGTLTDGPLLQLPGWEGENSSDEAGYALSDADDWDGDGHKDIWLAAPNAGSNNQGRIYLVSGGASSGLLSDSLVIVEGFSTLQRFGQSISSGDSDGDGNNELLACAPDRLSNGACFSFSNLGLGVNSAEDALFELSGTPNMHLGAATAVSPSNYGDIWFSAPLVSETANQQGLVFRLMGQGI